MCVRVCVSSLFFLPFVCVVIVAKLFVNGRGRVQTDVNKLRSYVCTMLNGVSWHAKKA